MSNHQHFDAVLVETADGKFGWFFSGKITGEMSRKAATRKYPRGVQIADLKLERGCIYCSHARFEEAGQPRITDAAEIKRCFGVSI